MPLYAYACDACGHEFEQLTMAGTTADPVCPSCESPKVARGFGLPARPAAGRGLPATGCGEGPPCALPTCGRRNR
jgi:putative FmdB family regulatory protein